MEKAIKSDLKSLTFERKIIDVKKVGGKKVKPTLNPDATTHLENTLELETFWRDPRTLDGDCRAMKIKLETK